jgi:hypothetical protein
MSDSEMMINEKTPNTAETLKIHANEPLNSKKNSL